MAVLWYNDSMSALEPYFEALIKRVEESDIGNNGKDKNGFFKPTRTVILRQLHLLKDLHDKPRGRKMVLDAWKGVVQELPPDWLILNPEQKAELREILEG